MKTNLRTHRSIRLKWMAALFFAFGIGNALPAAARYSRADEFCHSERCTFKPGSELQRKTGISF